MNVPFPDSSRFPDGQLAEWQNTNNNYPELQFAMEVSPKLKLLEADDGPPTPERPLIKLAWFRNISKRVELTVQASVVQHEISLENYYRLFSQISGEEVIAAKDRKDIYSPPDLLMRKSYTDGSSWIIRRAGRKIYMGAGAVVITVSISAEEGYYRDKVEVLTKIFKSFRLIQQPEYELAERLILFGNDLQVDFASYLPESWTSTGIEIFPSNETRLSFSKRLRGETIGAINIFTGTPQNSKEREEMVERYLRPYYAKGLDPRTIQFSASDLGGDRFKVATADASLSWKSEDDLHLKLYVVDHKYGTIILQAYGDSRRVNFEYWAINRRALEICVDKLVVES